MKVSEHYIIDYCNTSPRNHKHQCFTYLNFLGRILHTILHLLCRQDSLILRPLPVFNVPCRKTLKNQEWPGDEATGRALANLEVSHVEVPTEYDWFLGVQLLHVVPQVNIPLLLEGETLQTLASIGHIWSDS